MTSENLCKFLAVLALEDQVPAQVPSSSCSPDSRAGGSALPTKHLLILESQAGDDPTVGCIVPVGIASPFRCSVQVLQMKSGPSLTQALMQE